MTVIVNFCQINIPQCNHIKGEQTKGKIMKLVSIISKGYRSRKISNAHSNLAATDIFYLLKNNRIYMSCFGFWFFCFCVFGFFVCAKNVISDIGDAMSGGRKLWIICFSSFTSLF